jgi:undecaprenyl diphosphate synthase
VRSSATKLSAVKGSSGAPPRHVAFVPDGNTRWARARGLTPREGYIAGVHVVDDVTTYAIQIGIEYLTFYLLSLENVRRRSSLWLEHFFEFALTAIGDFSNKMKKHGCRVKIIGNMLALPHALQRELTRLVDETKNNSGTVLVFAVAYSGQDEILRAVNGVLRERFTELLEQDRFDQTSQRSLQQAHDSQNVQQRELSPVDLDEFRAHLDLNDIPPPDLLIRSANELRLSGFLLWYLDYTELAFTSEFWPDFSVDGFIRILDDYQLRTRNFGRERA